MGPFLQELPHPQQKHHGAGGAKISPEHGYPDGRGVQNRHLQPSPGQAPAALGYIAQGFGGYVRLAHRIGHKPFSAEAQQELAEQFFLTLSVQLASGIFQQVFRYLHLLITEGPQRFHQLSPVSSVGDGRVAGFLVHLGLGHVFQIFQIIEERISLARSHGDLGQMNTDTPLYLVSDDELHASAASSSTTASASWADLFSLICLASARMSSAFS